MAKIDFSTVLTNLDGESLKDDKQKDLTIGAVSKQSLLAFDEKATGEQKYEAYTIATKIAVGGEVELKSEEVTKIKAAIGKYLGPVVVGQAWDILEDKSEKVSKK